MQSKQLICTSCPIGCKLTVYRDETSPDGFKIEGNTCKRGRQYAINELTDPRRILTSTVTITGAIHHRLPVRTESAVPKDKIFDCMAEINDIQISSPIEMGDIIIENIASTGINLISSRNM